MYKPTKSRVPDNAGGLTTMNIMSADELLKVQLEELRREHRALDERITELSEARVPDQLTLKRLKKHKLVLKDQITRLEDQLYPDIIA